MEDLFYLTYPRLFFYELKSKLNPTIIIDSEFSLRLIEKSDILILSKDGKKLVCTNDVIVRAYSIA